MSRRDPLRKGLEHRGSCRAQRAVADDLATHRDARFEAEAKYEALVAQIPGVVYLDPVDEAHDSIFVSPQVRDLLGVEPEDWIADQYCWSKHVHPDDFVRAWDEYMYCVLARRPSEPRVSDGARGRHGQMGPGAGAPDPR